MKMVKELYDIVANVWVEAEKSATPIEKVVCRDAGLTEKWFPLTLDHTLLYKSPGRIMGLEDIDANLLMTDIGTQRYFITRGKSIINDPLHVHLKDALSLKYKNSNGKIRTFKADKGLVLTYDNRTINQYQKYIRKIAPRDI